MPGTKRSGNSLTRGQYLQMFRAYLDTRSIAAAARAAGTKPETARRYILKGTERFKPIAAQVAAIDTRALKVEEQRAVERVRKLDTFADGLINQGVEALKTIRLRPAGIQSLDDDGNEIVEIDGAEWKRLIDGAASLHNLHARRTAGSREPAAPSVTTNVGVVIHNTPSQTRDAALEVLRTHRGVSTLAAADATTEHRVIEILAAETSGRSGGPQASAAVHNNSAHPAAGR